jgi:hypothetical protein
MWGQCNVTATSQYLLNIVHSHRQLNEWVIPNSTIALQDSRRIAITVVTLAPRTYCAIQYVHWYLYTYERLFVRTRLLIEYPLINGRDMAVTAEQH